METVKIRCKDLMVGDWVANRNGSPMQIVAVDEDNAYACEGNEAYACEGNEERTWIFGDDEDYKPEPIILTPEILEKNGWYYGLTSDEEYAEQSLGGCHYNRHWCYDEGAGSISLIFTNDTYGGELIIDDQSFNRHLNLFFCDTLHVHELQRELRLCGLNELADNFKIYNNMELNDYQNKAMSTCMDSSRNMSYMAMGLTSAVGEFMGKIAKAIRKGDVHIGNNDQDSDLHYTIGFMADPDRCREWESDLKHKLGDILWFAAGIAEVMGWTLEEVDQENIDKLASRQKRGVIEGNGDNR